MFKELNILLSQENSDEQPFIKKTIKPTYKNFESIVINGDYSSAWKKFKDGIRIFRGDKVSRRKMINYGSPEKRQSKNTQYNFYTVWFSGVLPSWKEYPRRDHCIVCTTSLHKAYRYGADIFYIFPKNGTEIGICPSNDIWDSFWRTSTKGYNIWGMNEMNNTFFNAIYDILYYADYNDNKRTFIDNMNTIEGMNNGLKILQEILSDEDFRNRYMSYFKSKYSESVQFKFTKSLIENGDDIKNFLNNMLNPEKNNFQLITIEDMQYIDDREVWFDNEFILISDDCFRDNIFKNKDDEYYSLME